MRAWFPLLFLFSTVAKAAVVGIPAVSTPNMLCQAAIAMAEQAQAIPTHLLAAVGKAESGRRDEATGTVRSWPWTINAEGDGAFFNTKADAIAAVRALQARGVRSIDVGCMQVNLMYHPDAFASLEQAFDPSANAGYAARFLRQLYGQAGGDWTKAVGLYHSATPSLSEPYAKKVMALYAAEPKLPAGPSALASAWSATLPHGVLPPAQRTVGPVPPGAVGGGRGLDLYRAQPVGLAPPLAHHVSRF
jgi:soluble lytic murein transglycosylase-like protein